MCDYPLLFSKLRLGPVELRSRIVLSPMTTGFGFAEGVPDETFTAYFRARSRAVGMVVVAFGAVAPEGRVEEQLPWMWREDIAEHLRPLVAAVHAEGALACLQLGHGGRQVSPVVTGLTPVAPSPVPPPVHVKEPPHELSARRDRGDRGRLRTRRGPGGRRGLRRRRAACRARLPRAPVPRRCEQPAHRRLRRRHVWRSARASGSRSCHASAGRRPGLALVVRMNGEDIAPGGIEAGRRARGRPALHRSGSARDRGLGRRLRIRALHDPAARRSRGLPRRAGRVPEARADGAGAHGRRHRAAVRRRGGAREGATATRSSSGGR